MERKESRRSFRILRKAWVLLDGGSAHRAQWEELIPIQLPRIALAGSEAILETQADSFPEATQKQYKERRLPPRIRKRRWKYSEEDFPDGHSNHQENRGLPSTQENSRGGRCGERERRKNPSVSPPAISPFKPFSDYWKDLLLGLLTQYQIEMPIGQ